MQKCAAFAIFTCAEDAWLTRVQIALLRIAGAGTKHDYMNYRTGRSIVQDRDCAQGSAVLHAVASAHAVSAHNQMLATS